MPSSNVPLQKLPLTRLPTLFPAQYGVPNTGGDAGFRTMTQGQTLYVDPTYPGATDSRDGTEPTCPFLTIAGALARCVAYQGDTILVMPNGGWQYASGLSKPLPIRESVIVTVPGVRIVGDFSSSSMGIPWESAAATGWCITVRAIDVLIEGFLFQGIAGGANGIYCEWGTYFGDNLTVRHCTFADGLLGALTTAIQLDFAYNCDIWDCTFQGVDYGIYNDPADSGIANSRIHDNWFHDCGYAISVAEATDCLIADNHIYSALAQAGALATNRGINTGAGARNIVTNNWLSCVLPVGANGDYADLNSGSATDAWINCHCTNGDAITTP